MICPVGHKQNSTYNIGHMELVIEGVIKRVCKPVEKDSGFRKCDVHVTVVDGEYSQIIPLTFLKKDVDEALSLPEGKTIKARCNVRGNEWQRDSDLEPIAFLSLIPWKYEIIEGEVAKGAEEIRKGW